MVYECDRCNYSSKRRCDLLRHVNKKYPCYKKIDERGCSLDDTLKTAVVPENINATPENINATPEIINATPENINATPEIINATPEIINATPENINADRTCVKCNRLFSRHDTMKSHYSICDGYDKKQCKICLRMFATAQGKHQHIKYVKCNPPSVTNPQIINNIDNSTHNTINLNFRGDFDKVSKSDIDNIVKQLEKSEYIQMIQQNMRTGKYAVPRTIEHIYFNDDHPNMQILKKERRNDKMVEVHVDGKWEKRLVDDIMKKLITKVEEYHRDYFKYLEEKFRNIPIGSKQWNVAVRPIKTFGHLLVWYDGFSGKDIENIGISLNRPDDDKETKARNKDMKKLIKEKIYELTPKDLINVYALGDLKTVPNNVI
uniref:C2H2-type domain-containing protein n=1 Tax=Pyramimonas orientalis virus TaxID=455367 RepID=A0A7M3UNN8_POV01|nr:hypothetical protein HWQ62_00174 [Pyramimonas orientalis virus]